MRLSWANWLLLGILILPFVEIVAFAAVAAQIGFASAFAIQLAARNRASGVRGQEAKSRA
jgi:UPF0716 family protein affecting phage T7 exclusion